MMYRAEKRKSNIVIFGMGNNGMIIKSMLDSLGLSVLCFCDNDIRKHGTLYQDVACISMDELSKLPKEIIIFISNRNEEQANEISEHLKMKGFLHVYFLGMLMKFIPKIKDLNVLSKFVPMGHFYSLYPDFNEIKAKETEIFDADKTIRDINLNESEQFKILDLMSDFYSSIPNWLDIEDKTVSQLRYRWGNSSFSPADTIALHCMLRLIRPKRMIEVGSGYTSAITLDTNEFYLNKEIELTFIEPYPQTLKKILKQDDTITLIEKKLQDVAAETFETLEAGDILFIDSTHVSKIDSDVNYLFFEIFPRLKKGVIIHLHDIEYPFEYPKEWILKGLVWNEAYLLRAFLQNNNNYKIMFFQSMVRKKYKDLFLEKWNFNMPIHGGSIWLRKDK